MGRDLKKFSFGADKPDSVPRLATLRPSFLSTSLRTSPAPGTCPTMGCGIPVTIGRAAQSPILPCTGRGLSCRPPRGGRGGLLPHLFTLTERLPARRYILCDTFRQRALRRAACARGEAGTASCPTVSGLSSPNFKTDAAFNRVLGSKNLERQPGPKAKIPSKRYVRSSRKSRVG